MEQQDKAMKPKPRRGNPQNLIPANRRSKEEVRKNSALGGIRSGETRRRKRDIRMAMEALLEKTYKGDDGTELSGAELIALRQMEKAMLGDAKAFELVRDSAGQKPVDKVVVSEIDAATIKDVEEAVLDEED